MLLLCLLKQVFRLIPLSTRKIRLRLYDQGLDHDPGNCSQICILEIGTFHLRSFHVRRAQIGSSEIRVAQITITEVDSAQVCLLQITVTEIGSTEVDSAQIHAS